jgi:glutamyl-tRNA synthetase
MKERMSFINEIPVKGLYFFKEPEEYEADAVKKRWNKESREYLEKLLESFKLLDNPSKEDYETALKSTAERADSGAGKFIHPLRLAVSGVSGGPGVYDIVHIIGKEETIRRIEAALKRLP